MSKFRNVFFVIAMFLPVVVGVGSSVATTTGCQQQDPKTVVRDALTATQILCVIASEFTDAPAVMKACAIEERLAPLVEPLLAQKAAAKRAGECAKGDGGK